MLVEGSTFAVSGRSGDFTPSAPQGLFVLDTRILSELQVRVDGEAPESLGVVQEDPFAATFVHRIRATVPHIEGAVVLVRRRWVGEGMREDLVIRNYGTAPAEHLLQMQLDADFADLFEVKDGRATDPSNVVTRELDGMTYRLEARPHGSRRGCTVAFSAAPTPGPDGFCWRVSVEPGDEWHLCLEVTASIDGIAIPGQYRCGQPVERALPKERLALWRESVPKVETDNPALAQAVRRAADDLGSLRMFDPDDPTRTVVAAGAPWFMALFGRDSILTAWMALIADPALALGILQTLARLQGSDVDPVTEEQPGRIAHEVRFGPQGVLALAGKHVYYGTTDATPLFVMLLGELRRWGLADAEVQSLLPHADRALAWIAEFGDGDGDGYVEYAPMTDQGLANQGWKDSWDAIRFADGRFAAPPIALCEVQAYTYGAYMARWHFAEEAGDTATARRYATLAANLKAAFNRDFWLEDRQAFALALDGDKRPVDAIASNMGHCLWTGIIDEDKASPVAEWLAGNDLHSGWGVRTLASSMAAYNPVSYHNGSVWPHDNGIIAAGLMRYGFVDHAHRVITAMLDVAQHGGGRLAELFCGFDRAEVPTPIEYPSSCSPQAWSAASPLLMVRTLLRLDPWIPHGRISLSPALPDHMQQLCVRNIPLAGSRVTIEVDAGRVQVDGLTAGITVDHEPRRPTGAPHTPAG